MPEGIFKKLLREIEIQIEHKKMELDELKRRKEAVELTIKAFHESQIK